MSGHDISAGFLVLHSHRLENLRDVLVHWLRAHPLRPLENEVVLVQSNGMAQWLKAALAADPEPDDARVAPGLGLCAALQVVFPSRFLWRAYRDVLGEAAVPRESPFDKPALAWRILRVLPALLAGADFEPLRVFLADDQDGRKAWQLAQQLADLFDQYQVYRADWLADWTAGRDQLRSGDPDQPGEILAMPARERWQPQLWRALEADVRAEGARTGEGTGEGSHRAALHEQFLAALRTAPARPRGLPRRIVVWGLSTLPRHVLEALAELGRHVQVILAVVNPCRYYWADLVQPRQHLRHARKQGLPSALAEEMLGQHANPLLLAWGQQGRDYLRLLERYDDPAAYRERFQALGQRIDLFDEPDEPPATLLAAVQRAILDLEPAPADVSQRRPVRCDDRSLRFQVAHSRLREVEALHDHLLATFAAAAAGGDPLQPQDVVVMVPDIRQYAPLIQAVFGAGEGARLPYAILDRPRRGELPLLTALEWLLQLPQARCTLGEIWDLLDVPALRARFGLADGDLARLRLWLEEAGARWGLDADHRARWQLPAGLAQNTWRFALDRLLLGYAAGSGERFAGTLPQGELSALDAAALGPMERLLDALSRWSGALPGEHDAVAWGCLLRQLLDDFFQPETQDERWLLEQVRQALEGWERDAGAGLPLSLTVVREAWLSRLDEASMSQRFLGGSVHFATLMPMRAIPFRVVCILGLNDGEFPRQRPPVDFDLMAYPALRRGGDRSRREDDRYLFLEALLSAREQLLLSWVGRSARNNQEQPPSLLIGQLQDYLGQGWHVAGTPADAPDAAVNLLAALTTAHPLQPFSARYFQPGSGLRTYAAPWRRALDTLPTPAHGELTAEYPVEPLGLEELLRWLRNPAADFYQSRLGVRWRASAEAVPGHEPFSVDGLDRHQAVAELFEALAHPDGEAALARVVRQRQGRGQWPLAGFGAREQARLEGDARALWEQAAPWRACSPEPAPWLATRHLVMTAGASVEVSVEAVVPGLRRAADGSLQLWHLTPSRLHDDQGRIARWQLLLAPWLAQVLLVLNDLPADVQVLSPTGITSWPPLPRAEAEAWWRALLARWLAGRNRAMPCEAKTALAYVASRLQPGARRTADDSPEVQEARALQQAEQVYEGGDWLPAAGAQPPLAWLWPSFADLAADGEFAVLADVLYTPLVSQVLAATGGDDGEEG